MSKDYRQLVIAKRRRLREMIREFYLSKNEDGLLTGSAPLPIEVRRQLVEAYKLLNGALELLRKEAK